MAEGAIRIAHVNQETVLPSYVAAAQVLVHKEGLAGAGRPQQEYVVVLNQPCIQGLFLNVESLRDQPDAVAHFENAVGNARVESVINIQTQGAVQLHRHVLAECKSAFIARDRSPELRWRISDVPHRGNTQLGYGRSHQVGISGGKHVQMASGGAHLLDGRRLQILVDFLGVFAVFCVPCAHGLHLPALAIQTAVNVFQRLLYAVPVHHVLAVQRLANLVQV